MTVAITVDLAPALGTLKTTAAKAEEAALAGVTAAAHLVEGRTKTALSTYSHKKGTPTPSPGGSPPAIVTGALRYSVMVEPHPNGLTPYADVGPSEIYGRAQELGYPPRNLPARPYLEPSFRKLKADGALQAVFAGVFIRTIST